MSICGSLPARLGIVVAGIVLGQAILYGPSLAGRKVLLPLDHLLMPGVYVPRTPDIALVRQHDLVLADLVCLFEPARRFAVREWQAGRLPQWVPYHFSGAPLTQPIFSPFRALQCCTQSPVVLAWSALAAALVAGVGFYAFSRRALGAGFWPAAICAWCYPLTAFFIFWQGYPTAPPVDWLPWLLLAVWQVTRGEGRGARGGWQVAALAMVTGLVLVSGQLDVAGQVLLGSGLYGLWRLFDVHRPQPGGTGNPKPEIRNPKQIQIHGNEGMEKRGVAEFRRRLRTTWTIAVQRRGAEEPQPKPRNTRNTRKEGHKPFPFPRISRIPRFLLNLFRASDFGLRISAPAGRSVLLLAAGWGLGFLLAAPQILPLLEYSRSGVRMIHRSAGREERPPVGFVSLPQVVLPLFYGSTEKGSFPIVPAAETNLLESPAAAYAGLLAALFVAPLAFCRRHQLRRNCFWALLALLGLSWCLNLPGFVQLLRLPGLNMMSHNRLVFLTAFAVLALACGGLEVLARGLPPWRGWFWLPVGVLLALGGWCAFRMDVLPEPIATQLVNTVMLGHPNLFAPDVEAAWGIQRWFAQQYAAGAILCGLGLAGWGFVWARGRAGISLSPSEGESARPMDVLCAPEQPGKYGPLSPALSPSEGERVPFRAGEGSAAGTDYVANPSPRPSPLRNSLSPSEGERVPFRAGEGSAAGTDAVANGCTDPSPRPSPLPKGRGRGLAWFFPVVGGLLVGELLWFGYGRNAQCDPALYFPPIPALEQVAKAGPGRIIGNGCLPADLAALCGLRDVRGYDAIDPARMTELLNLAAGPTPYIPRYAVTQWLAPKTTPGPDGTVRLPPVLDMLGVRYVIFRGEAPPEIRPVFQSPDYWVLENRAALPRAFVPRRVEVVAERRARLAKLAAPEFDPRSVAYVEAPVTLPEVCDGQVEIRDEIPARIRARVRMATPGLVVLADQWDPGWRAYLDGKPVPILRVNHAVRGVVAPAGTGTLEFRYEPASFTWGLRCAAVAAVVLLAWLAAGVLKRRNSTQPQMDTD